MTKITLSPPTAVYGAERAEGAQWYRCGIPWLVILLLSSAVTASLVSLYLAAHTTDVVLDHADASE